MQQQRWFRALPVVMLAGVLAFGASCGNDDDDDNGAETPQATRTTATTPAASATTGAGDAPSQTATGGETTTPEPTPAEAGENIVKVADIGNAGPVLVTEQGFVLYIFTNDGDGVSNCSGACASTWPPLLFTGPSVADVDGADGEFTLITRADGAKQVAFEGQPLYTYAADITPGQANGDGVGGVWFVAKADPD